MKTLAAVLSFPFFFFSISSAAPLCRDLFNQGLPLSYLGSGLTATVYRVGYARAEVVLKRYRGAFRANRSLDIKSLELLKGIHAQDLRIRVVQVLGQRGHRDLILENIQGVTLETALTNEDLGLSVKMDLLSRYYEYLTRVQDHLYESFGDVGVLEDMIGLEVAEMPVPVLSYHSFENGTVLVTLKPNNIIVDANTHEMVIIDPH